MNSLPRLLGMGLLVVLAALVALLVASAWREVRFAPPATPTVAVNPAAPSANAAPTG